MSRQRNPKRETIMYRAQELMLSDVPPLHELAQVDQSVRLMLVEGNPFRQQWIRFFDRVVTCAD